MSSQAASQAASQEAAETVRSYMPKRDDEIERRVAKRAVQTLGRLSDEAAGRATRRSACDEIIASRPTEAPVVETATTDDFATLAVQVARKARVEARRLRDTLRPYNPLYQGQRHIQELQAVDDAAHRS